MRVRVGVVLGQRRVEVGGEPAVDVDVRLQLHELEIDADVGELGLQVLGDVDVRLALPGDDDRLHREAVGIAAVGEQLAGEVGVGAVAGQPVVWIGGVVAFHERPRRHAFAEQRRVDQLLAVDGAGDRLANLPLLQRAARAVEEEREVAERLGAFEHERLGHLLDHRRVGDHPEVDFAGLQGGEQGLIVGYDSNADPGDVRPVTPVRLVGHDVELLSLGPFSEGEGPGPVRFRSDRFGGDVIGRQDRRTDAAQRRRQRGIGSRQAEDHGEVIGRGDLFDREQETACCGTRLLVEDALEGGDDVLRRQLRAVVERDALTQCERQLGAVLVVRPFGCQARLDGQVGGQFGQ